MFTFKDFLAEGDVIRHKFDIKQQQKGKTKYKHHADIAKDIPMWDPVKGRNVPSGVDYPKSHVDRSTLEPYDHFEVKPTGSGNSAHIVGVTSDGYKVRTSTTTLKLANALVDAYNRGGFSEHDIRKVPLKTEDE